MHSTGCLRSIAREAAVLAFYCSTMRAFDLCERSTSTRGPLIAFEVSERVMEQTSGTKREKRTDDAAFDGKLVGAAGWRSA